MRIRLKIMVIALTIMCMQNVFSQSRDVTGNIKDTTGSPLPGVSVMIKGNTNGTSSDFDGNYSISKVSNNSILVFSYLGMKSQEILVGTKNTIDVVLQDDATSLEEIVVIGYGTQKKGLVTGANVNLKGEKIQSLNTTTPIEGLQGIAPGVNITRNNGQPGAGTKVVIRGLGTIGNSNPLYVVDGVSVGNIDYLSASDIESLDVLKDAASAAIFGSRAANGVILITTKKGKKNSKVNVSYNTFYGIQNIYKTVTPLNAQEYLYINEEAYANDGKPLPDWEARIKNNSWLDGQLAGNFGTQLGTEIWDNLQNGWEGTNWVDEMVTENAAQISHSININGGSENSTYAFGASYLEQEGLIGNHITDAGYKRLTARMNSEHTLFKNDSHSIVTIGQNLTYTNTENRSVATGNIYYNDFHNALVQNPLMPAYWQPAIDNNINEYGFTPTLDGVANNQSNPLAVMFYRHNFSNLGNQGNQVIGNVYAEIEPIKNLKFRSSFGFDAWFGHSRSYSPTYGLGILYSNSAEGVGQSQYQGLNNTYTNTLSYKTAIGNHEIEGLVGIEKIENVLNTFVSGNKSGTYLYPGNPNFAYLNNFGGAENVNQIGASGADYAAGGGGLLSYFARAQYNYKEKYLFSATMRADGSSNFAPENRWGYFPSFSAGWVMTNEDFISEPTSSFLSYAKLRASWGQNGNQSIPSFIYGSNIAYAFPGYFFGDTKPVSGNTAFPSRVPNPNVKWETSEQLNFGLDAQFFNSRLGITLDWYQKTTKDWLIEGSLPGTAGAGNPFINGGDVQNTGFEFSTSWNENLEDFSYGATITGAFNKNKVTRIDNLDKFFQGNSNVLSQGTEYISRVEEGMPVGFFYGYQTDGILQNQSEVDAYVTPSGTPYFTDQRPGDVRFVDQNQDGIIDSDDKVMLGNPNPDFELGIQLNAQYKGFYANITMAGKFGMQVMKSYRSFADSPSQNYTTEIFSRWHGEGTSNRIPRLSSVTNRNTSLISDIYMHDADYLRINNLTFGYDLLSYFDNIKLFSEIKIYTAVNNLYTFTGYNGMDPEVGYGGDTNWASGVDLGLYPLPRTVMFGLNLRL
jgi:TonB-linked SusC/RagA family outer membrane protein